MRIVIIDDHPLITESVKNLLLQQPEIEEIATFNNAETFLSEKLVILPNIIICDILMPGINGLKLLELFQKEHGDKTKFLIMSSIIDVQTIKQTIRAGAKGYISKSSSFEELVEAISEVAAGKQYICKNLRESMLNQMFTEEQVVYHLSPREKDVLQKVCSGLTIKEIAYDLKLSIHTVQYYHRTVMSKLKVKRTSDLIVFAMQNGLYIPDINKNS